MKTKLDQFELNTTELELTKTFYPEQLYIELSDEQMISAWAQAEQEFQNDVVRWRAYLNYLIVEVIPQIKAQLFLDEDLRYDPATLLEILEYTNGTILNLGDTRFVVIPSDGDVGGDLCVYRALVELDKFKGDYYLGVYINLEEKWLRFWGACTYQKLKEKGNYDEVTNNYYLDRDELIQDLEVVLIAREILQSDPINKMEKFMESDDPVAVEVRKRLEGKSISEIVTKLNETYIQTKSEMLPDALRDILVDSTRNVQNKDSRSSKSLKEEEEDLLLLKLARDLAGKLRAVWGDAL